MKSLAFVFRFGWPYVRRYWTRFAVGLSLAIVFGLFNASFVWATKTLFSRLEHTLSPLTQTTLPLSFFHGTIGNLDRQLIMWLDPWLPLVGRSLDWRQVIGGLMLIPLLVALRGTVGFCSSYELRWVNERVMADLRCDVLRKLNGLSIDYFNKSTVGDMTTRVNQDTAMLHQALYLGLADLMKEPITVVTVVGALFMLDWQLTLLALVFLPLCVVPVMVLGKKVRKASVSSVRVNVSASSLLIEALRNVRIVQAFGLEEKQNAEFRRHCNEFVHYSMKATQSQELVNPLVETIASLGVGAIIIYVFFAGHSVSNLMALLAGVVMLPSSIKKIANLNMLFQRAGAGVDRLREIFNEQPTVKEKQNAKVLPPFSNAIELKNVSFSYIDRVVVKDVNLKISKGWKLGVTGESGAGKSTLVNLIYRFYDVTAGSITVDGFDIRDVTIPSLRAQMALVSQEILLFNRTVAENIAFGREGATRQEIEQASRRAAAHEFVMQLPKGYETVIGEAGVTLSGGQRQRLSIARAFVRNAPILLLDEATASLDSHAESEIQNVLEDLAQDRTVITIAHRLSTLKKCDEIVVLNDGRIAEQGTFENLVSRHGLFTEIARRQGLVEG